MTEPTQPPEPDSDSGVESPFAMPTAGDPLASLLDRATEDAHEERQRITETLKAEEDERKRKEEADMEQRRQELLRQREAAIRRRQQQFLQASAGGEEDDTLKQPAIDPREPSRPLPSHHHKSSRGWMWAAGVLILGSGVAAGLLLGGGEAETQSAPARKPAVATKPVKAVVPENPPQITKPEGKEPPKPELTAEPTKPVAPAGPAAGTAPDEPGKAVATDGENGAAKKPTAAKKKKKKTVRAKAKPKEKKGGIIQLKTGVLDSTIK